MPSQGRRPDKVHPHPSRAHGLLCQRATVLHAEPTPRRRRGGRMIAYGKTAFFALGVACSIYVLFWQGWTGHVAYGAICAALNAYAALHSVDEWPTKSYPPQRIVHPDGSVDHVYDYWDAKVVIENAEEGA